MRRMGLRNWRDPNIRFKIILLLGALSVLGLFIFSVSLPLAMSTGFCGSTCHQNPEFQALKRSSHAAITCQACHTDSWAKSIPSELFVEGPTFIYATLAGKAEVPYNEESEYSQKHLPKERCLRCHSPNNRNFTVTKGLNVTSQMHVKHLDAGLQCTTCHNRVAHNGAENFEPLKSEAKGFNYKNFLTMQQGCWRCHSEDPKYRNEETLAIIKNGKTPPTSCITCHNQDWKLKPTVGEYNHNEVEGVAWRVGAKRHGLVAKKDFSACFGCHPQTGPSPNGLPNCSTTCHEGITMPHNIPKRAAVYANNPGVPPWRRIHFKVAAEQGTAMCRRCHDPEETQANFCQTCHHQQFASVKPEEKTVNWKSIHFMVVKKIGAANCFQCHQPNFCANCHTTGIKPAPGQFFNKKY